MTDNSPRGNSRNAALDSLLRSIPDQQGKALAQLVEMEVRHALSDARRETTARLTYAHVGVSTLGAVVAMLGHQWPYLFYGGIGASTGSFLLMSAWTLYQGTRK